MERRRRSASNPSIRLAWAPLGVALACAPLAGAADVEITKVMIDREYPRLETVLAGMYMVAKDEGDEAGNAWGEQRGVRFIDAMPRLRIIMQQPEYLDPTAAITAMGGAVLYVDRAVDLGDPALDGLIGNEVGCVVPASRVADLQSLPDVRFVTQPIYAAELAEYHDEGAVATGATQWHDGGQDGSGHLVVVLDSGFGGAGAASARGDLPNPVTFTQTFRADGLIGAGVHGTGCAEIVHDMAPGADIALVAVSDSREFVRAALWIYGLPLQGILPGFPAPHGQNVEIVSCSLGFWTEERQDGAAPATIVANLALPFWGKFWANAAGNFGREHWKGAWADADGDKIHEFPGADENLTFTLAAGQWVGVNVDWADPWGAAANDVDLRLYNAAGNVVASDIDVEPGKLPPVAFVSYRAAAAGVYQLQIRRAAGAGAMPAIEIYSRGTGQIEHFTSADSVMTPANGPNVEAVGAIDYTKHLAGGPVRPYSSRGPTKAGVMKPDICAPDGVSTGAYGFRDEARGGFTGTSAACPHVAGAVALIMCDGETTAEQARTELHDTWTSYAMGQLAPNNTYGHGLLALDTAATPRMTMSISRNFFASEQVGAPRTFFGFDFVEEGPIADDPWATLKGPGVNLGPVNGVALGQYDDMNGLSLNTRIPYDPVEILFSVDCTSAGAAGTDVAAQVAAAGESACADVFESALAGTNILFSDGDGSVAAIHPGNGLFDDTPAGKIDDLDGFDFEDSDPELDWRPRPIYLVFDSPTAAGLGVSAADVFVHMGGFTTLYRTAAQSGLMAGDDIDGLIVQDLPPIGVYDATDDILFSLTPLSPTVALGAAGAADVLRVAGGAVMVKFGAAALGLKPEDNVDALDVIGGLYEYCAEDVVTNGFVDFFDLLAVLSAWGPCGPTCPADIDGNGAVGLADLLLVLAAWGPCP
jgi:hypothetical protein